ncbi:MAG TPA: ATP-binding protein, partial [Polyangiaceae bacterium]|nr:ATP-binding protein [Polyangiaceae bacterium]
FRSELASGGARAASLLCFPLRRMQTTRAIVYLENRLSREAFTARRIKALELLSSQAVISLENARLYDELEQKVEKRTRELLDKNAELGRALQQVTEMQRQLVTQEKLAALGALTAGIAHEIKNPLNFITNFADVSARLSEEVEQVLEPELDRIAAPVQSEVNAVLGELRVAVQKIAEHGARATAIINGMAAHARGGSGPREPTQLNALLAQSVELAAHAVGSPRLGELQIRSDYDPQVEPLEVVPQDISRVFVNLINNARYAMEQKHTRAGAGYAPVLNVVTRDLPDAVEIRIEDNGIGIPQAVLDKIFVPFFTTKAAGQGTGLGLSISHEIIVRGHGGELRVESVEGQWTQFIIRLPKRVPKSERWA